MSAETRLSPRAAWFLRAQPRSMFPIRILRYCRAVAVVVANALGDFGSHVRLWHLADISADAEHVRFRPLSGPALSHVLESR